MSHECILVIGKEVNNQLRAARNGLRRFDDFQVGGRWAGALRTRDGRATSTRVRLQDLRPYSLGAFVAKDVTLVIRSGEVYDVRRNGPDFDEYFVNLSGHEFVSVVDAHC